jgi:asparagine synthase (glutamine-hydrolysing)
MIIERARQLGLMWRYLGPQWLLFRLRYAAAKRTGSLRRALPASEWNAQPLASRINDETLNDPQSYLEYRRKRAPRFFFQPSDRANFKHHFARWDEADEATEANKVVCLADDVMKGVMRFFSHTSAEVGAPPRWHANSFTGEATPAEAHWSDIGDFGCGDIKIIWEPSRFGFAYTLARAYWRTGDERYPETFWRFVEDWQKHNQPQRGANWKCGQETSLRVMAWCFAFYAFLDSATTTPARVSMLAGMIGVSAYRIAANLDYALSQRNNHGISEGVGLWTIGALFPEFVGAKEWRTRGREVLETCGRELIYDDGSFSQHSMNYHRVMLHDYVWALRLGELLGEDFSSELKERVARAGDFLYQLQDDATGRVPCYGANDGALILPLDECDYRDYRPVVNAVHYLTRGTRCYAPGAYDEDLLWLFGSESLDAPIAAPERANLIANAGGYYTLRGNRSWAFMRCASFSDRPAQADMLHVDVWWRGRNIALDAGTFSYNAPAPWNNSLGDTAYHNTVAVAGLNQMNRAGKFLWLPWLRGKLRARGESKLGNLAYLEGEHDGYERLRPPVLHRRALIRIGDESWLVLDRLHGTAQREHNLQWLLDDAPYFWDEKFNRVTLEYPESCYYLQTGGLHCDETQSELICNISLVRADQHSPRGWQSPYYNQRQPALSIKTNVVGNDLLLWSLFTPDPCAVNSYADGELKLETRSWQASIELNKNQTGSLVSRIIVANASPVTSGQDADANKDELTL